MRREATQRVLQSHCGREPARAYEGRREAGGHEQIRSPELLALGYGDEVLRDHGVRSAYIPHTQPARVRAADAPGWQRRRRREWRVNPQIHAHPSPGVQQEPTVLAHVFVIAPRLHSPQGGRRQGKVATCHRTRRHPRLRKHAPPQNRCAVSTGFDSPRPGVVREGGNHEEQPQLPGDGQAGQAARGDRGEALQIELEAGSEEQE
mmetsp:Transcript_10695/g.26369  ORF Transcript_10695/g.26369 Transcript_10695/m.26369 type:complete len:205 (-) Transcript_10695:65-679(-)